MIAPMLALLALVDPPTARVDAVEEVRAALELCHASWAEEDHLGALELGSAGIRAGALALSEEGDPQDASALADELEILLVFLTRLVATPLSQGHINANLEGIQIAPQHGMAYAELAFLRANELESLGMLTRFEFAGPFGNERGAGLQTQLPPELEPDPAARHRGAVREVGWRTLPVTPPARGLLRFNALIDPSDGVCVLARTFVHSEEARAATLLASAGVELRVWHDGAPVLDARGEHSPRRDALAAPLQLRAGWNELSFKVGSRDGSPSLSARLIDSRTAQPLHLESRALAPEGEGPSALSGATAPSSDPRARPGAWSRWAGDPSPEAQWRLALLALHRQSAPQSERPGREAASRAVASAPSVLRYRTLHALLTLEVNTTRAERNSTPWLAAVNSCLALDPHLPRALGWLAVHARRDRAMPERALGLVEQALVRAPGSLPLLALRADCLRGSGQPALSTGAYGALLEHPQVDAFPRILLDVMELVEIDPERRLALLQGLAEGGEELRSLRLLAELGALLAGRTDGEWSLELLAASLEIDPYSRSARRSAARRLLALDRPGDALAVVEEALELAPEWAAMHGLRARVFMALDKQELAIHSLERELELDFSAAAERRLLEHLRDSQGAPFHAPYREELDSLIARLGSGPPPGDAGATREVLLQRNVIEVQPDGTAKRYHHLVQRILQEAGARDLVRFQVRAQPDQEARMLGGRVRHPDGSEDILPTGRANRRGLLSIDLPPLATGDVVEFEWRLDDLRPSFFGRTFGLRTSLGLGASLPVRESELLVLAHDELPLSFHQRNFGAPPHTERTEAGLTLHRWRLRSLPPAARELPMPPSEEWMPLLEASSYGSWEELGAWWWNLIEDEIRLTPEMRAAVVELTASCESPLDELRAIYEFVIGEVRYNAWEFGVHGYEPYSAPVIFGRRFGDCKDKAILLRAMLSAVDIEAFPVLIRSADQRALEDHSLPLVEHFNHVIAWIPEQAGVPAMFLDGTATRHPLEVLPPSDLGAQVVIVRPDGIERARVPWPPAAENVLEQSYRVDLTQAGAPHVVLERRTRGIFDPGERARLSGEDAEREERAEELGTALFGALAEPPTVATSALEDLSAPAWSRFELRPESLARPARDGFELPAVFEEFRLLSGPAAESERRRDLVLSPPRTLRTKIEYVLPEGARPRALPPPVQLATEDALYSWRAELVPAGLRVIEEFALKSARIPPERYGAFRALARAVQSAQSTSLEVEVQP